MRYSKGDTYLEQFGNNTEIGNIRREILLVEGRIENTNNYIAEMQVNNLMDNIAGKIEGIYQKQNTINQRIQSDIVDIAELLPLEKLKKDNWYYSVDIDLPNLEVIMLDMFNRHIKEYNRLYIEATLCLEYLEIQDGKCYSEKYNIYLSILREMYELIFINQLINEKWRENPPDLA